MKIYDRRDIEQLKGANNVNEEYISVRSILISVAGVLLIVLFLQV